MQRAQYIRFIDAIMSPGRGGPNISKAYLVELDDHGARKPMLGSRDEIMDEILVGDVHVFVKNARGVRMTPLHNVKDWEPAPEKPAKEKTR